MRRLTLTGTKKTTDIEYIIRGTDASVGEAGVPPAPSRNPPEVCLM